MQTVTIKMNGQKATVPAEYTVLQAADHLGVNIPTLCKMKDLDPTANCRICVVEVEKARTLLPACATRVGEGMVIQTDSERVRTSRKMTLELMLARHSVDCHHCLRIGSSKCDDLDPMFCEMCFFCDCVKDGFCELQALARAYKVDVLPFEIEGCDEAIDDSTDSVIRNPNKCIKCRRCIDVCNDVQTVHNLKLINRGTDACVKPELGKNMAESSCVLCGKCIDVCPTGAIYAKEHLDEILEATHSYDKTTIAQVSSDILAELADLSKIKRSALKMSSVIAGLYKIGVDYVVEGDYSHTQVQLAGASLMDEALQNGKGPLIMTNSFAAARFVENHFPGLSGLLVQYPSEQAVFGNYFKGAFAEEKGLDTQTIRTISVSNNNEDCSAALQSDSVDWSVNARELYRLFMRTGVNLKKIHEKEAFNGMPLQKEDVVLPFFGKVQWSKGNQPQNYLVKSKGVDYPGAVTENLGQTRVLLDEVVSGKSGYRVIRLNA